MMKKLFLYSFLLVGLGSLSAQSIVQRYHQNLNVVKNVQSGDSLKILAVLVDFQPDKYDGTVGNGKFGSIYTQDYGDTIIDPLPHNAQYFSDHLEFAKNYYRKVSKGKVNITYKVLPDIITVSKTMREYSPGYKSQDLTPLGNFAEEVWSIADQKYSNVNFSDYDLFVIFHAGVSAGLIAPFFTIDRNLPSLYLSEKSLNEIFGSQFKGFQVDNGSYFIKNSMIMSETESREFDAIDGSVILTQITINGALVSNIASYLGLPDLFNTETSTSAIGKFGLMDGEAIYANSGMFPPEPSAWEKMYLGWLTPTEISNSNSHINITTHLTAGAGDTVAAKIPINSSEYFLVENRQQDANHDNLKITYKQNGQLYTRVIMPDTNGVYYVSPDSIAGGVVVDVDEFDAAVPGNGIVIWHIDDNIINAKLPENKINSDLYNKGIDVEEADGTQDIGEYFTSIFGDIIGSGSYEDFWYSGNTSKLYKNKFSFDTKPNTNSNAGAKSLISFENFSAKSNKMSFDLKFGDEFVNETGSSKIQFENPGSISIPVNDINTYAVLTNKKLHLLSNPSDNTPNVIDNFSSIPVVSFYDNTNNYVIGSVEDKVNFEIKTPTNTYITYYNAGKIITSPFVINKFNNKLYAFAGTHDGSILQINLDAIPKTPPVTLPPINWETSLSKIADDEIIQICKPFDDNTGYYSAITKTSFVDVNSVKIVLPNTPVKAAMVYDRQKNNYTNIVLGSGNHFSIINGGSVIKEFNISSSNQIKDFSILCDNKYGTYAIVINNGNEIDAYSLNGIMLDNFPINEINGDDFASVPLTTDLNGDLVTDIISVTSTGSLHAYDGVTGKELSPFPISTGPVADVVPFIYRYTSILSASPIALQAIAVIDGNNYLHTWTIGTTNDQPNWGSEFGNSMNNATVIANQSEQLTNDYFPVEKAYNWPNPVYGNTTNIRYFVSENSIVKIKIFDISGDLAADFTADATGGVDNETVWDVSKVQSGIYYAHIEVNSSTGKSASKIIKIAVIK